MGLTSTSLLVFVILLAALSLGGVIWLTIYTPRRSRSARIRHVAAVAIIALLGQGFAVFASGLAINNQYGFYTSWDDLFGNIAPDAVIATSGLLRVGSGRLELLKVPNAGARDNQVLTWLPPQYDQPRYRRHRFPVVMFLPAYPGNPTAVFIAFKFAKIAMSEITSGRIPPFIGVVPTLTIAPPRDTECTDVPGGPLAASWLAEAVPAYLEHHLRVAPTGPAWSVMGWSVGAFCAAKLIAQHPRTFSSAVGFGGYYETEEDGSTGRLFGRDTLRADQASPLWRANSPLAIYENRGFQGDHLLVIAGRQDRQSWKQSARMIRAGHDDPAVSYIAFPYGGHNYRDYRAYLGAALDWAARFWGGRP